MDSGRELLKLPMPEAILVYSLAFSPDGTRLAAGDKDQKRVWIWDARNGRVLQDTRWDDFNFRLAFSPDGRRLAGVHRYRVELRDVEDGREILILRGFHPGRPTAASTRSWPGVPTVPGWPPRPGTAASPSGTPRPRRSRRRSGGQGRGAGSSHGTWMRPTPPSPPGQPDAAAFHLDEIERLEPADATSLIRRADIAVRLRRLDAAHRDYARWLDGGAADGLDAHIAYARLFLLRGDVQGYRRFLDRSLESFESRPDAPSAWQLGRIIGLAPCSAAVAERVARLIRTPAKDSIFRPRQLIALAMALYRAEQWESARSALEEFLKKPHDESWLAHPLMAMVEHRLGHHREAEAQFSKAREDFGEHRRHTASADAFLDPGWFDYERLYHEAETLIRREGTAARAAHAWLAWCRGWPPRPEDAHLQEVSIFEGR